MFSNVLKLDFCSIRPSYLLEKALAGVGTFCVIYVITEHWIMPHKPSPDVPIIQTFLALAVPMLVNVSLSSDFSAPALLTSL